MGRLFINLLCTIDENEETERSLKEKESQKAAKLRFNKSEKGKHVVSQYSFSRKRKIQNSHFLFFDDSSDRCPKRAKKSRRGSNDGLVRPPSIEVNSSSSSSSGVKDYGQIIENTHRLINSINESITTTFLQYREIIVSASLY